MSTSCMYHVFSDKIPGYDKKVTFDTQRHLRVSKTNPVSMPPLGVKKRLCSQKCVNG